MFPSLEVLLDPLIRTRIELLYKNLKNTNPHYSQFTLECDQYFQQIRESVPNHVQEFIYLYEDAQISLQAILENKIYLQGFADALHLLGELQVAQS
ncbi:hypothetical protein D3C76_133700 [compost metagenome]